MSLPALGPDAEISPADILFISLVTLGDLLEFVLLTPETGEHLPCCPFPNWSLFFCKLIIHE